MLAQPLSVLLTAFAAVAASSVGGETEPGVRLTLMRPSNSTAMARLLSSSRPYLFIYLLLFITFLQRERWNKGCTVPS